MIIKPYEFQKINFAISKVILMYGKNEGYKKEIIKNINQVKNEILNYEQNEIIENENILYENIFSGSLFNNKKIIIIKRITDKFLNIIEKIDAEKIEDSIIIFLFFFAWFIKEVNA